MPTLQPTSSLTLDPVGTRLANLEARLAALEAVIVCTPGGDVAIMCPTSLVIQATSNCTIDVGGALSLSVGKSFTASVAMGTTLSSGGPTTIRSGNATLIMKPSGDTDLSGSRISVRASSDLVLKGSRILQN